MSLMKVKDPLTGLPKVKETRTPKRWNSLPRYAKKLAYNQIMNAETTPWYPRNHVYEGNILTRTRCWKCGVDLKSWRMMLDGRGNRVEVGGMPAVAFLPLSHATATPFLVFLPLLNVKAVFHVQHCLDCSFKKEDGLDAWVCCIAGSDDILISATSTGMAHVNRDVWATHLYRYSEIDHLGPISKEAARMHERIPAPGELITSAQYALDIDRARRNAMPAGVIVKFKGEEIPPGWGKAPGSGASGMIIKL